MQVKDYFYEIQNLIRRSTFIDNVDVEYNVEVGIVSYGGRRKKGLIQLWNGWSCPLFVDLKEKM